MAEQPPPKLWFNGSIVPWEEAKVHVWSELAVRGASVFDGIRAFWNEEEGHHHVLNLDAHLNRLFFQSAKILGFPTRYNPEDIRDAIFDLLNALDYREMTFIRPTLFIETGRYGFQPSDTVTGAYVVSFPMPRSEKVFTGIRCCVSTWRRAGDLSVPPRVKAGAFYQGYRLSRIEVVERGYDEIIFLNSRDMVAETSGASIFIIRDGVAYTPPITADILESITRKRVMELLQKQLDVPVVEREINRTELYIADEVFACGTINEIQPIIEVDNVEVGSGQPGPITVRCRDLYFEICRDGPAAPDGWLTPVPVRGPVGR
jgi:branched-chain amino acid aminotransferase